MEVMLWMGRWVTSAPGSGAELKRGLGGVVDGWYKKVWFVHSSSIKHPFTSRFGFNPDRSNPPIELG